MLGHGSDTTCGEPGARMFSPRLPPAEKFSFTPPPAGITFSWVFLTGPKKPVNGYDRCTPVVQMLACDVRTVSVMYVNPSPAGVRVRLSTHGSGVAPAPVHGCASTPSRKISAFVSS